MLTPKEALERLALAYQCPDVALTETISLIQLDAFKTGMTEAAEIGYNESTVNANPESRSLGTSLLFSTAGIYKKAILSARNQKTTL